MTPSGRLLSLRNRSGGSFAAEYFCRLHGSPNDVVDHVVPTDPCITVATRETVNAPTFPLLPRGTEMRLADADAESHANGDPDGLVRHS